MYIFRTDSLYEEITQYGRGDSGCFVRDAERTDRYIVCSYAVPCGSSCTYNWDGKLPLQNFDSGITYTAYIYCVKAFFLKLTSESHNLRYRSGFTCIVVYTVKLVRDAA